MTCVAGHSRSHSGSLTHMLSVDEEVIAYSSADEASQPIRTARLARGGRSQDEWRKKLGGPRPSNLSLQKNIDPTLSRSYDSLATPKDKKVSPLLPNVVKSPSKLSLLHV